MTVTKKPNVLVSEYKRIVALESLSDTAINRFVPNILTGVKVSKESLDLFHQSLESFRVDRSHTPGSQSDSEQREAIIPDETRVTNTEEQTQERPRQTLRDAVRAKERARAIARGEIPEEEPEQPTQAEGETAVVERPGLTPERDTTPQEPTPHPEPEEEPEEEKPDNAQFLYRSLAQIREILRSVWGKTAVQYKQNQRWFALFLTKIEKTRELLNNKEDVVGAVKEYLIEKSKEYPDEAKIDADLQRKAELISEAYGIPGFMKSATTMGGFRVQLEKLMNTNRPVEKMVPNIRYEIDERNFKYFGYKRSLKVLSEEQLNFQKSLSDQFVKLALTARKECHPERLIESVKNFTHGKKTVNAEGFEQFILKELLQPFFSFTVNKELVGNISDDYALDWSDAKSVQEIFENNGENLDAFKLALYSLIPAITQSRDEEKLNYFELRYDRELVIKYTQRLKDAVNNGSMNRAHLCDDDGQRVMNGTMMDRNVFEKMLREARIDPNSEAGLVLGKTILRINSVLDDFVNKAYLFWAKINNIQVKILNNQLNALNSLSADIANMGVKNAPV